MATLGNSEFQRRLLTIHPKKRLFYQFKTGAQFADLSESSVHLLDPVFQYLFDSRTHAALVMALSAVSRELHTRVKEHLFSSPSRIYPTGLQRMQFGRSSKCEKHPHPWRLCPLPGRGAYSAKFDVCTHCGTVVDDAAVVKTCFEARQRCIYSVLLCSRCKYCDFITDLIPITAGSPICPIVVFERCTCTFLHVAAFLDAFHHKIQARLICRQHFVDAHNKDRIVKVAQLELQLGSTKRAMVVAVEESVFQLCVAELSGSMASKQFTATRAIKDLLLLLHQSTLLSCRASGCRKKGSAMWMVIFNQEYGFTKRRKKGCYHNYKPGYGWKLTDCKPCWSRHKCKPLPLPAPVTPLCEAAAEA